MKMKSRCLTTYFFIGISLLALVPVPAFSQQESSSSQRAWLSLWEKAKDLERKGSYLEARGIYESLLREKLESRGKRIRREYETLNMKILFSPLATPDSIFHEVVAGDTLSKLAKKYGTTVELLQRSNRLKGDLIYAGKRLKVTRGKFSLSIRKRRNTLTLTADGKPIKKYKVATGEKGSTPAGTFQVTNKLKNPTWFHAGLVLPPESPDNILGTRWMGFDVPGYGIHGTTLPHTIGTQASKGCIRMLNEDVEELYDVIPVGTRVVVQE